MAFGTTHTGRAVSLQTETDGVVTVTNNWSSVTNFSVEAWVKPAQVLSTEGMIVVDKGESWNLLIEADGKPAIQFPGGIRKAKAATVLEVGKIYHLVGTQSAGTFKIYVNGVLDGEYTSSTLVDVRDRPISIGRGLSTGRFDFVGLIDEVAIYNTTIGADAILKHYEAGK
jgi:hypothetical protein